MDFRLQKFCTLLCQDKSARNTIQEAPLFLRVQMSTSCWIAYMSGNPEWERGFATDVWLCAITGRARELKVQKGGWRVRERITNQAILQAKLTWKEEREGHRSAPQKTPPRVVTTCPRVNNQSPRWSTESRVRKRQTKEEYGQARIHRPHLCLHSLYHEDLQRIMTFPLFLPFKYHVNSPFWSTLIQNPTGNSGKWSFQLNQVDIANSNTNGSTL
jgi:hypothetical protein